MPESNNNPGGQEAPATGAQSANEQPSAEDLAKKVEELTAASRKWEERAKENYAARQERDELKKAAMSAEERTAAETAEIVKRAEKAEQRASAAEAALVRYKIATEFALSKEDAEALEKIQADEATLRALAERFAAQAGPRPRPRSQGAGDGKEATGSSTAQQFANTLEGLF